MPTNAAQDIDQLQRDYLANAIEQVEQLDALLVELEKGKPTGLECMRILHTLKGSLGSYGFELSGTICHHFESLLSQNSDDGTDSDNVELMFRFRDLLGDYLDTMLKQPSADASRFQKLLKELSPSLSADVPRVLFVDQTKTFRKMISHLTEKLNMELLFAQTGLEAFNRLITDKFDILITSNQVGRLTGHHLLEALAPVKQLTGNAITCW